MTVAAEPKAAVRNAADAEQVRRARETDKQRGERLLAAWGRVAETDDGMDVLWDLLDWCNVFRSIMETNARIYYNAGQQDLGQKVLARIALANPEAWIRMQMRAAKLELNKVEPKPRSEESIEDV